MLDTPTLVILGVIAALIFYDPLGLRHRAVRHPVTGKITGFWLSSEAADLIAKFDLILEQLPRMPRWSGPLPWLNVLVVHVNPPPGSVDVIRYRIHLERSSGRIWVAQLGGIMGIRIVYGPQEISTLESRAQLEG